MLLSDIDVISNSEIVGTISVQTTDDDDFIGFVFGFQQSCAFYLFSWKQGAQVFGTTLALQGMSLRAYDTCPDDPTSEQFSESQTVGTTVNGVTTLRGNSIAWDDFTDYEFRLQFDAGMFTIEVTRTSDSTLLES